MQFGTNYICWGHLGTCIGSHLVSGSKLYVVTWTFLLAKGSQLRSPELEDNLAPGTLPVILELLQHCSVTAGNPISQTSEVSLKLYRQESHSEIHCSNNCVSPSSAVSDLVLKKADNLFWINVHWYIKSWQNVQIFCLLCW